MISISSVSRTTEETTEEKHYIYLVTLFFSLCVFIVFICIQFQKSYIQINKQTKKNIFTEKMRLRNYKHRVLYIYGQIITFRRIQVSDDTNKFFSLCIIVALHTEKKKKHKEDLED